MQEQEGKGETLGQRGERGARGAWQVPGEARDPSQVEARAPGAEFSERGGCGAAESAREPPFARRSRVGRSARGTPCVG